MKKWTKIEEGEIIELLKSGKNYEEIGLIVNRTKKSIKEKLKKLGYKFEDFKELHYYESKICLCCEKEISNVLKSENRKFCSSSCSATYNNTLKSIKSTFFVMFRMWPL